MAGSTVPTAADVDYYGYLIKFTHVDPSVDWLSADMPHLDSAN